MVAFEGLIKSRVQARAVEGAVQVDFTGGLRLVEDGERIETNELRECINMDPLPSGGIARRTGVMPFASSWLVPGEVIPYVRSDNGLVEYYSFTNPTLMRFQPGVAVSDSGLVVPGSGPNVTGLQIGRYLYLGRGGQWSRYDGVSLVALAAGVRLDSENHAGTGLPDFSTFTQPGIPGGYRIQAWNGRAWLAGATVGGKTNRSSVHFSYSFGPGDREGQEDFYENWAYNFDQTGQDEVLAMVPLGDKLFVFLNNSVHSLSPYLGERLSLFYDVEEFKSKVGLASPYAYAVAPDAIWFYDPFEGLMRIGADGTLSNHMVKIQDLKKRLFPDVSTVALGFWDGKVWVSVCETIPGLPTPTANNRTYVYDSALDSWTIYELPIDGYTAYRPTKLTQPTAALLGVVRGSAPGLVNLTSKNDHSHDHYSNVISTQILGRFKTAWFDTEVPEAIKDWRNGEVVYRAKSGQQIRHRGVIDWNPLQVVRETTMDVSNEASWDDGREAPLGWEVSGPGIFLPLYGVTGPPLWPGYQENNLNNATLVTRTARRGEITGPAVGQATKLAKQINFGKISSSRALSLEFSETTSSGRWGVDRITLFYSPKPIRTP